MITYLHTDDYLLTERFAQLMNGWLFGGEECWKAEDIQEADRRTGDGRTGTEGKARERYRDLFKKAGRTLVRLYVGTELMEYVDYAMPLRVMDCDALSYLHQKKTISRKHMEQKDLPKEEFLSRFSKEDRLLPVITLVLYCGDRPWDGADRLHEMLDFEGLPEKLKGYVEDYSIHILDVCHTQDEKFLEFPSEIRFLLMCIKYAKDKEAFLRLMELEGSAVISEDTYETIAEYLGEPELLENKAETEGGGNMCEAIRALVEDGRQEGRQEGRREGENDGIELARQIFKLAGKGEKIPEIARLLSVPEEKVRWVLR